MIGFIRGKLAYKDESYAIVDNNGIGFEINIPSNSFIYTNKIGDEVQVFTLMMVREDDISLYGFDDRASLIIFKKLINISGVGAKAAISLLSSMPLSELKKAIIFEDVALITTANGIGKKTAQRIVLELREKLDDVLPTEKYSISSEQIKNIDASSAKNEAVDALISLGYSRSEAMTAIVGTDDGLSAEEYIKIALKNI